VIDERTPSWGIEPVPDRLRVLGLFDTGLLWANLSVSLLVIVAGALLVPALSLPGALGAIVVGAVFGNLMLGAAALIGQDSRVPQMVLLRAPLGRRGSYLATGLNVIQCLGWATFELLIIATAAAALSDQLVGARVQWLWTLLFGALTIVLAFLGPVGFVRRYIRKFAGWIVLVSLIYLTWWALHAASLHTLWNEPGKGGFPSFWQGVDLVLASVVSWTPLVADYTRFSRTRSAAFWGAGGGYFFPTIWMFGLGAVLLLDRGISDAAALPAAVAAGGVMSLLALFALTVDESDEAFANVYSGAVSLQNLFPAVSQRLLVVAVTIVATCGALVLDFTSYQTFLYLLGSFFVPLFGVLFADWLFNGRRYTRDDIFRAPAFRPAMIVAWIAGFAVYQWLSPQGPSWWLDLVDRTHPAPWDFSASLPSFAAAFVLAGLAVVAERRFAGARLRTE
jgi:putative hydroxymethylpyrimidine transporter CytX